MCRAAGSPTQYCQNSQLLSYQTSCVNWCAQLPALSITRGFKRGFSVLTPVLLVRDHLTSAATAAATSFCVKAAACCWAQGHVYHCCQRRDMALI